MHFPRGAFSSAIIYNLVETTKANDFRLYDYFKNFISEMSKHLSQRSMREEAIR